MRRIILSLVLLVAMGVRAQTNMAGRVYHHPNIMAAEMKETLKDVNARVKDAKAKAVAEVEKKKGRKITAAEEAEIDAKLVEAQKLMEAMEKGMKASVTVTFKDERNLTMDADMKIDEAILKSAGVSWAKRKLLKMAMAAMPTQKAKYSLQGNLIIVEDEEEPDTLRLSDDGKYLYGTLDKKHKYKLTRIQ